MNNLGIDSLSSTSYESSLIENNPLIKISHNYTLDFSEQSHEVLEKTLIHNQHSVVNLAGKKLKEVKDIDLLHNQNILEIDLNNNILTTMNGLPNTLKSLNLRNNRISFISEIKPCLMNLEILDLTSNRIICIDGLSNCRKLKELYLGYNFLSDQQIEVLFNLKELTILDVSHNHLKEQNVIKIIESLEKLTKFINNSNDFNQIMFNKGSTSLKGLYIDDNKLTTLQFLRKKPSVFCLSIKNNSLTALEGLNNIENLETLSCDNNKLKGNIDLSTLQNLMKFTANSNQLEKVILNDKNTIEHIDLGKNDLNDANILCQCINARYINLAANKITCLPNLMNKFVQLVYLDLSKNRIKNLKNMEIFPNLNDLNISYNQLDDLISLIKELSKIKKLNFLDIKANLFNQFVYFDSLIISKLRNTTIEDLESILRNGSNNEFWKILDFRSKIIKACISIEVIDGIRITKYEKSLFKENENLPLKSGLSQSLNQSEAIEPSLDLLTNPSLFDINTTYANNTNNVIISPSLNNNNIVLPIKINGTSITATTMTMENKSGIRVPQNSNLYTEDTIFSSKMLTENTFLESQYCYNSGNMIKKNFNEENSHSLKFTDRQNYTNKSIKQASDDLHNLSLSELIKRRDTSVTEPFSTIKSNQIQIAKGNLEKALNTPLNNKNIPELCSFLQNIPNNTAALDNSLTESKNYLSNINKHDFYKISLAHLGSTRKISLNQSDHIEKLELTDLKKHDEYSDGYDIPNKNIANLSESALVNEITNEINHHYQKYLEGLKDKLKESIKKIKGKNNITTMKSTINLKSTQKLKTENSINSLTKHENDSSKSNIKNYLYEENKFLEEKVVERLENDKKVNDNPYFLMFKEVFLEKKRSFSQSKIDIGNEKDVDLSNTKRENLNKITKLDKEPAEQLFPPKKKDFLSKNPQKMNSPEQIKSINKQPDQQQQHQQQISKDSALKQSKSKDGLTQTSLYEPSNDKDSLSTSSKSNSEKHLETKIDIGLQTSLDLSKLNIYQKTESKVEISSRKSIQESHISNTICKNDKKDLENSINPNIKIQEIKISDDLNKNNITNHLLLDSCNTSKYGQSQLNIHTSDNNFSSIFMDKAFKLFYKYADINTNVIDGTMVFNIMKDLVTYFKMNVKNEHLNEILNEIKDFIPKKLTEQAFFDIFQVPKLGEFFSKYDLNLNLPNTSRFPIIYPHSINEKGYSIIKNSGKINESNQSINHDKSILLKTKNESSSKTFSKNNFESSDKENVNKNANLNIQRTLDSETDNSQLSYNSQFKNTKLFNKSEVLLCEDQNLKESITFEFMKMPYSFDELYEKSAYEDVLKLLPYAQTPPRPIFSKESNSVIVKEIMPALSEYKIISSLLNKFCFSLKKVVKTYSYPQNKTMDKFVKEQTMSLSNDISGEIDLNKSLDRVAYFINQTTLFFHNELVLFHSANIEFLSELIQKINGFKDVYKERPGDLVFSSRTKICTNKFKRYYKKIKQESNYLNQDSSSRDSESEIGRWRLLICKVYLGKCHLEKSMSFKEFAYFGEVKVQELLKSGFHSVYFKKNDIFLVLYAECCVPLYLCEYQFSLADLKNVMI